jgi:hypothetical protein
VNGSEYTVLREDFTTLRKLALAFEFFIEQKRNLRLFGE